MRDPIHADSRGSNVVAEGESQLLQAPEQLALNRKVPVVHTAAETLEEALSPPPAVTPSAPPTHILVGARARRIEETTTLNNGLVLQRTEAGITVSSAASATVFINSELASAGQLLNIGDHLTDETGFNAQFIVVED